MHGGRSLPDRAESVADRPSNRYRRTATAFAMLFDAVQPRHGMPPVRGTDRRGPDDVRYGSWPSAIS